MERYVHCNLQNMTIDSLTHGFQVLLRLSLEIGNDTIFAQIAGRWTKIGCRANRKVLKSAHTKLVQLSLFGLDHIPIRLLREDVPARWKRNVWITYMTLTYKRPFALATLSKHLSILQSSCDPLIALFTALGCVTFVSSGVYRGIEPKGEFVTSWVNKLAEITKSGFLVPDCDKHAWLDVIESIFFLEVETDCDRVRLGIDKDNAVAETPKAVVDRERQAVENQQQQSPPLMTIVALTAEQLEYLHSHPVQIRVPGGSTFLTLQAHTTLPAVTESTATALPSTDSFSAQSAPYARSAVSESPWRMDKSKVNEFAQLGSMASKGYGDNPSGVTVHEDTSSLLETDVEGTPTSYGAVRAATAQYGQMLSSETSEWSMRTFPVTDPCGVTVHKDTSSLLETDVEGTPTSYGAVRAATAQYGQMLSSETSEWSMRTYPVTDPCGTTEDMSCDAERWMRTFPVTDPCGTTENMSCDAERWMRTFPVTDPCGIAAAHNDPKPQASSSRVFQNGQRSLMNLNIVGAYYPGICDMSGFSETSDLDFDSGVSPHDLPDEGVFMFS